MEDVLEEVVGEIDVGYDFDAFRGAGGSTKCSTRRSI